MANPQGGKFKTIPKKNREILKRSNRERHTTTVAAFTSSALQIGLNAGCKKRIGLG
jgi:hypothetical protein